MKFGVSFADPPPSRVLEICTRAERNGFQQGWAWDSHVLWQECYSLLGWLAAKTSSLEFGTCVTNPRTRDVTVVASAFATLSQILNGRRIMCGIGKGDSAVRLMKRGPVKLAALEEAVDTIRSMTRGEPVVIDGVPVHMKWAKGGVPIYIAAYGPKALRLVGRKGDGVIFQIGDPFFVEWAMQHIREGAREAGRDMSQITIHCSVVSVITKDLAAARDQVRWFPAMVGNHLADILRYHDASELPSELRDFLKGRKGYDYREHTVQRSDHAAYVPDEIVDRFTVIGDAGAVRAKIEHLRSLGVSEFNLFPHVDDFLGLIDTYGREIVPKFRS